MGENTDLYDVIVVGTGPAGSTAAYFMGASGLRVLVLEKETLPRYKTCGGGLSANLLEQFPFSFEPVIESRVKAVSYVLGDYSVNVSLPDRPVRMVMRQDFDAFILSHAKVETRQGETVRQVEEKLDRVMVRTQAGKVYTAHYLVGADGANSVVAHSLGLRKRKTFAAAIEVEVPVSDQVMAQFRDTACFIFGEVRLGYLWIFPKSNHLSVGIGALHPRPGELQTTLKRVMARFNVILDGSKMHGHPIPLHIRRERIATSRCLLVGDAAGLVDPFTGEGIRFAVKSGRMAAEAIVSRRVQDYAPRVHREISVDHMLATGLALLFYRLPHLCYALGVRNPFATQAFIDLLADQAGYAEVIFRLFGTLPVFLFTEGLAVLAGWLSGPESKRRLRAAVYPLEV